MLDRLGDGNDAVDIDAGRVDVVRIQRPRFDQMFDLGHGDLGRCGHHWIEVSGGHPVDEIALGIALIGMHQCQIGGECRLHDIVLAIECLDRLALGDDGADAGFGEKGRNAGAAGTDAFGKSPLWIELDLKLSTEELLGEDLVVSDI